MSHFRPALPCVDQARQSYCNVPDYTAAGHYSNFMILFSERLLTVSGARHSEGKPFPWPALSSASPPDASAKGPSEWPFASFWNSLPAS